MGDIDYWVLTGDTITSAVAFLMKPKKALMFFQPNKKQTQGQIRNVVISGHYDNYAIIVHHRSPPSHGVGT